MKTSLLLSLALAASVTTTAVAQDRNYQVVRAADSQMACEAMATEINALTAETQEQLQRAQRDAATRQTAGRVGRGLLSGLARGATMFGYGSSSDAVTSAVAGAAVAGVAEQIANPSQAAPAPAATQPDTPQLQRLNHLRGLYGGRC